MNQPKKALIVIDVQNDYFPGGKLPLWNAEETLQNIVSAIRLAREKAIPVILVQHIVDPALGFTRFFVGNTEGVKIHDAIMEAAPDAPVVVKHHTDAFRQTRLNDTLDALNAEEILVCGMQTQNCVGLTAISEKAGKYRVKLLGDCCTAQTEMVHLLALSGFGDRVPVSGRQTALS